MLIPEVHDIHAKNVLEKVRNSGLKLNGLKLNRSKYVFGTSEVSFLGHIISAEGIRTDHRKV